MKTEIAIFVIVMLAKQLAACGDELASWKDEFDARNLKHIANLDNLGGVISKKNELIDSLNREIETLKNGKDHFCADISHARLMTAKQAEHINELTKEKEDLRREIDNLNHQIMAQSKTISNMLKNNEQLREEIRILKGGV